ncbi:hypothetical protein PFICI_06630 [Pestalotiopsis fici W106-1]|uniref:Uncharacterized protein n=1 Tax=Pestalotiopsis fici (strain W106-1 / CGMCC3.15140) TaxID=1229662 RepID=W3X683_PESFW|nr:uncharacterized protein PFICI_06630 [Pestalotiopsis fici W106-1]ETS81628.1 hypothetical protein PFICI_06630 [Pestalotiopsis fici W106-1]
MALAVEIAAAVSLLYLVYLAGHAIYLLTGHPLAGIPGPKTSAISRIPYWRQFWNGQDVYWIHNLHEIYGPVVRIGPHDVSYASADAWKVIHGSIKGGYTLGKPLDANIRPANGNILTADAVDHARMRKLFSPAFSERALRKQEPIFQKYADIFTSKVRDINNSGQAIDMTGLYNFATFDVMADLCFGHPLGLLAKNEFSPWVRSVFESLQLLPIISIIHYYPVLLALFERFQPKSVTEQMLVHAKHSADRVDQRMQEGSDKPDIWNLVLSAQGTEKGLSLEEMHSNADLFMMAGSETTATLLSGVTYYLLMNPEKMQRLCLEVRGSFKSTTDINFDGLGNLKYLNACLKEAMRIYPPLPIGSQRIVPKGGLTILGQWIPEDTRVFCHHYSMYHSTRNFKNPESFVPERWLGDPEYSDDVQDAHQPFS